MIKRVTMVVLTLLVAIGLILAGAKNPIGTNANSFDEPWGLWLAIGVVVFFFLPPVILAFFNHIVVKIASAVYQGFIAMSFIVLIPVGFFVEDGTMISAAGVLGAVISISSIVVTIVAGTTKPVEKTA
ncbi:MULTISPECIES: hypothetical protein [Gracilibacillus]|uniref:hypothetical protein n=1 Tax=Gracilibacillus TaxID=74385 RepID=UPI00082423BE|nr:MULTISPECIES: hypothetical protein [Gracilibacillus]